MNAVEDYSRKWAKKKGVEGSALSECVKAISHSVSVVCIFLRNYMSTRSKSVFEKKEIAAKLADIHDKYVVPADKASNNVVFVCRKYYIKCLLGMGSNGETNKTIKPPISLNGKYILTTHQFFHHMVYHPQIRIMIFRYYIGYLNCTNILINNALLQDHQLVQVNHCPHY